MGDEKKVKLGQFFTTHSLWLKPQIVEFINSSSCLCCYDPFAGAGDLLKAVKTELAMKKAIGLDIDPSLGWQVNDSLISIPHIDNAIIITNPPYIAKQSATRKKINLDKYFLSSSYDDIYFIALDKMLSAQDYVVAIIPESFINSNYRNKYRLNSITILEENPFTDTENPVCVACFDAKYKSADDIKIYKNAAYVNTYSAIQKYRLQPKKNISIVFNDLAGWLGIRAVDSTDDRITINFDFKENINYDWENGIKETSRHFTLVNIDIPTFQRFKFVQKCNDILTEIRSNSSDILLTPFKGNTKSGRRRRRLDFALARAIMEKAFDDIVVDKQLQGYVNDKYRLFAL